ncbi:MAG: hypothetical protein IIB04_02920 [Acidobacteria bacterium]|nr:hypothetical protein [Acidobacteriota bacterium]MCH8985548.1 hypothetical protein [Acidobacteriota bacterium]
MEILSRHLAQINVAKAVGARDSVDMKGFIDLFDEVNAEGMIIKNLSAI